MGVIALERDAESFCMASAGQASVHQSQEPAQRRFVKRQQHRLLGIKHCIAALT